MADRYTMSIRRACGTCKEIVNGAFGAEIENVQKMKVARWERYFQSSTSKGVKGCTCKHCVEFRKHLKLRHPVDYALLMLSD